jgi:delta-aminolevulinic acid dehydratase/porphobilinogen synthase
MSRDICGICWCPYNEDGRCGCKPAQVLDKYSLAKIKDDEALLQQALAALQYASSQLPLPHAREIEPTIKRLEERLK